VDAKNYAAAAAAATAGKDKRSEIGKRWDGGVVGGRQVYEGR